MMLNINGKIPKAITIAGKAVKSISIASRKVWEKQTSLLPAGYTECEYIESTGTQYMLIDYFVNYKSNVYCKYMCVGRTTQVLNIIFGVADTGSSNNAYNGVMRCVKGTSSTGSNRIGFGGDLSGTVKSISDFDELNTIYEFSNKNNNITLKSPTQEKTWEIEDSSSQLWTSSSTLGLFSRKLTNKPAEYKSIARIYNFNAKEDDVIVLNLIPALDNTGIPCLYDTISGKTYYNIGNGEFLYKIKE